MTQAATVTRLAVRELWISYRLLVVLVALVGAGAAVALVPASLDALASRLGLGLGFASAVASAVAGWSIAEERELGRAGWLVSRSVPRGTLLAGWFVALAGATLAGATTAALLGWLAMSAVAPNLDAASFAAGAAAAGGHALAAVGLGLTLGTVLPRRMAAVTAALWTVGPLAVAWLVVPGVANLLPGGGFVVLAAVAEPGASVAAGLRSIGIGLATTALLLIVARRSLDRVEL